MDVLLAAYARVGRLLFLVVEDRPQVLHRDQVVHRARERRAAHARAGLAEGVGAGHRTHRAAGVHRVEALHPPTGPCVRGGSSWPTGMPPGTVGGAPCGGPKRLGGGGNPSWAMTVPLCVSVRTLDYLAQRRAPRVLRARFVRPVRVVEHRSRTGCRRLGATSGSSPTSVETIPSGFFFPAVSPFERVADRVGAVVLVQHEAGAAVDGARQQDSPPLWMRRSGSLVGRLPRS